MKTDAGVSSNERSRARTRRGAPTDSELRLWRLLRDRRLSGLKFRQQVLVGPYIVDFLCVGAKLIVEPTVRSTQKALVTISVTLIWKARGGRSFAFGTTRCRRIAKVSWRQFWRMQDPHPALRATFSLREKGSPAHGLLPKTKGWAKRRRRTPSPSGRRWCAEGATDEGCAIAF